MSLVTGDKTTQYSVLSTQYSVLDELKKLLPEERVLWRDYDLMLYEYDGSIDKHRPLAVGFPLSTQEVSDPLRICHRFNIPYTARGAGTRLSGAAVSDTGRTLSTLAWSN